MVICMIAKAPLKDAHDFTVANGWIELFEVEDIGCDRFGKALPFATSIGGALIEQASHAILEKTMRFIAKNASFDADGGTALSQRVSTENNRANSFVIELDGVGEEELQLFKVFRKRVCGHSSSFWRVLVTDIVIVLCSSTPGEYFFPGSGHVI